MTDKTKMWIKGLFSAIIGGAASGITVVLVDPETFNLFQGGAMELASMVIIQATVALGMYLKASPLP